jgi:hypothetical protein
MPRLTRRQILAFRRRFGGLDERMPAGAKPLRGAAWAGLQDSMPRAALLSLHARVDGVGRSGTVVADEIDPADALPLPGVDQDIELVFQVSSESA